MSDESHEFDKDIKNHNQKIRDINDYYEAIETTKDKEVPGSIVAHIKERVPRTDGGFNLHYSICIPEELNTPTVIIKLPIKVIKVKQEGRRASK